MTANPKLESALTDRYQTTVPGEVRRALHLHKRDRISYSIRPDGVVMLSRAVLGAGDDPVLEKFIEFIAHDIESRPQMLRSIDAVWLQKIQSLVDGVHIDLNMPLSPDDE